MITEGGGTHFDPEVTHAFEACQVRFGRERQAMLG